MPTQNATGNTVKIISFSNQTSDDKKLLKKFIDFHWKHYENDPQFIPLLDYEYLGFKLIGIHGFFEPGNLFFKHAEMKFFLAMKGDEIVGRCNAFVNHNHNKHWNDKIGFFGQFETIEDQGVADQLLQEAAAWLKSKGMDTIRGPQNLPVNEATPGVMTEGFNTRPVIYYMYNKPFYVDMIKKAGFEPVKRVVSWEVPVSDPRYVFLEKMAKEAIEKSGVTIETWGERPLAVRKKEMLEIYNDAWNDNFGFVPFTEEEFNVIIDDMQLVMDKSLFVFVYIQGEPAGFFGGIPNFMEKMKPFSFWRRGELLRAAKMLITKGGAKGFRLGYLGAKRKFHRLGLAMIMLWQQQVYAQKKGYEYCDIGWVLEDNLPVVKLVEMMYGKLSKAYTIFQKSIG
jgi:hypothetical protein